jgi:hypothetical protein
MTDRAWRDVERELQRARGARRALPFVAAGAASAALLAVVAGGSAAAALAPLALGLAVGILVWSMGLPRCPSCGGSLFRRGERPGSAGSPRETEVERTRRCPRCGARLASQLGDELDVR